MKKFFGALLLLALFIPLLWRPFALDINADTVTINPGLRLADARFSLSADPSAAYANPLVQMATDFHGIYRQAVFFPLFFALDAAGMPISRHSVGAALAALGFLLALLIFYLARSLMGEPRAFWFAALLLVLPFYAIMVKGGWWQLFIFPLFLAGLAAEKKWLEAQGHIGARVFAVAVSAYMISDTAFFFGLFFYALYAVVFLREKTGGVKRAFVAALSLLRTPWMLLPALVLLGMTATTVIGFKYFGAEFGILARFLQKGSHVGWSGFGVFGHFAVQAAGLSGFVLFPAMLVSGLRLRKRSALERSAMLYFWASIALIIIAGGSGGAVYVLYAAGLFMLTGALWRVRVFVRYAVLVLLLAATLGQTMLYQFGYMPGGLLERQFSFIRKDDTCAALWCPWHFAMPRNVGTTTLAWVVRDYLGYSPVPFISMRENFYERPKEIFFHNTFGQAPTYSIGRRISYDTKDLEQPLLVARFTATALEKYPVLAQTAEQEAVMRFLSEHIEYAHVATVTVAGVPFIEVYERDSTRAHQVFAVEEYDARFNERYGNLRDLGHIDLG